MPRCTGDGWVAGMSPRARSWLRLVITIVVAVGVVLLIEAFVVKPFRIPSASMEPTVEVGQRVLANRLAINFGDPAVGDIIVFNPPTGAGSNPNVCGNPGQGGGTPFPCGAPTQKSDDTFIKRVVAGPGDRIAIVDGQVVLNGKRQKESYTRPCGGGPNCNFPRAIKVPKDHYFMMGDNRGDSDDSRFWGPVPKDWMIGEAFFTYWPPDKIGTL